MDRALTRAAPWLVAVVVVLLSSALAGVLIVSVPEGLPQSSVFVQVLLPVMRVLADLVGILIVGCLLAASILLDSRDGTLGDTARGMAVLGARLAIAWLALIFTSAILTLADVFGLPVLSALQQTTAISFLTQSVVGHAFLAQMVGASAIAVAGPFAVRRWHALALLGVAALTMASRSTSGHSGVTGDHEGVTVLLAVHVVGVALWVGGLAAIGLLLLRRRGLEPSIAIRFSGLALWCVTAIAVTGAAQVFLRIPEPLDLFTSAYGLLMVAKTVLLSALIALGWLQRRRSLPALRLGQLRPFAVMVLVEVVLMAVVLGVSVTLSRTPTVSRGSGSGSEAHVHDLPGPPSDVIGLLAHWQVDAVALLAGLGLSVVYFTWRARAHTRDVPWGHGRIACFSLGLVVMLLASCSGLGTYTQFVASSMVVHAILLLLVVPTLLVLGIPSRELGRQRWTMRADPGIPIVVLLAFVVSVFATPALGYLLWPFWGRAFLNLAFLALGLWACSSVLVATQGSSRYRRLPMIALAAGLLGLIAAAAAVPGIMAPQYFVFFVPPYVDDLSRDELVGLVIAGSIVLGWLVTLLICTARPPSMESVTPSAVRVDAGG